MGHDRPTYEELERRCRFAEEMLEKILPGSTGRSSSRLSDSDDPPGPGRTGSEGEMKWIEAALRKSEERYRELVEQSNSIILRMDREGRLLYFNEYAETFFGYSRDEILGRNVVGTIVPDRDHGGLDLAAMIRDIAARPERYRNNENENMTRDGRRVRVSWTNRVLADGNGDIEVLCIGQDITDRKRAEEALRESRKRLADILDFLPDATLAIDRDKRVTLWNRAMEAMTGIPAGKMIGRGDCAYAVPFYGEPRRQLMDLLWETDREIESRYPWIVRDGETLETEVFCPALRGGEGAWVYAKAAALRDPAGNVAGAIESIRDITRQKRAEEALRESEERYRLLSELALEGILIHRNGIVRDANASMAKLLGRDRSELLGKNIVELAVHPDDRDIVRENIVKEYARPYEIRVVRKTGEIFFAEIEARDFQWRGDILRVAAVRDITERRSLEAQYRQAQKMESVGRLAGGVAHDFNNMLNVILGYAEIAGMRIEPGHPVRKDLEEISKAARRSADLTRQLLAFARRSAIAPRTIDLDETVGGMLKMLRRLIGEDIDLIWRPGADIWPIRMDPSQIDQILANLCVNARDAIAGVGRVVIETGRVSPDEAYCAEHPGFVPGDFALLAVSDDGRGMDRDVLEKIFEPFFTTKERGRGTGLGLSTVYGIVKQNRGFVNVHSEPDRGTTFRIYLPRYAGKADRVRTPEPVDSPRGGRETVLLVEDEPAILDLGKIMLERLGYRVLAAGGPGEALRLAREYAGDIHMLMTDVVMPEMNGRDLARQALALHPDLRRLFMSGYTADVIAHHGVLEPGVHFIQKPFSLAELAAKVREVLDEFPEET